MYSQDEDECKRNILKGPICRPVVVILHGINNYSNFGYMRSLQSTFVSRGWAAASMNFRGCGGVGLTTPRGYNGASTGDLRSLIHQVSGRLAENVPLFLVGNSLGANIMTKYLGEEGLWDSPLMC
jgi:predicted alpha/beta-fold hydrolase